MIILEEIVSFLKFVKQLKFTNISEYYGHNKEFFVAKPLKPLANFPNPDDESLDMNPTLAKYSAEDIEIYLMCFTRP
jgi:hypothetical protein